jgi:hypothetical protein
MVCVSKAEWFTVAVAAGTDKVLVLSACHENKLQLQ